MRHLFLICLFILQQFAFNSQVSADYSNLDHWLITPEQTSNIHEQFISDSSLISYADVFYVYPTVFLDKKNSDWNISIDDQEQRDRAKNVTKFQASAWSEAGRMFVPFYSQAHLLGLRLDECSFLSTAKHTLEAIKIWNLEGEMP